MTTNPNPTPQTAGLYDFGFGFGLESSSAPAQPAAPAPAPPVSARGPRNDIPPNANSAPAPRSDVPPAAESPQLTSGELGGVPWDESEGKKTLYRFAKDNDLDVNSRSNKGAILKALSDATKAQG